MKEFPKFEFSGKSYDLSFYDDMIDLYAVENYLSGVMVSSLIPAANDYVAALGFQEFIEKNKDDKQIYCLYRLGTLNNSRIEITDSYKEFLFDSRENIQDFIKEAQNFMISFNEEE